MRALIVAILFLGSSAFAQNSAAPSPAIKAVAFEFFGSSNATLQFYRTQGSVKFRMSETRDANGFQWTSDPAIYPGSTVESPPTEIFQLERATGSKTSVWRSQFCWPVRTTDTGNEFFRSLNCQNATGTCDIEFSETFGLVTRTGLPFKVNSSGQTVIEARDLASALNGAVPNRSAEFVDLTVAELRYGRIALSDLVCETNVEPQRASCTLAFEKDQNPFPKDRPWDDCKTLR